MYKCKLWVPSQLTEHTSVLHIWVSVAPFSGPQSSPNPSWGTLIVKVLNWLPPPQVTLQASQSDHAPVYIYVCMYVCVLYVCMYICIYVCMYICMYIYYVCKYVLMLGWFPTCNTTANKWNICPNLVYIYICVYMCMYVVLIFWKGIHVYYFVCCLLAIYA